MNNSIFSDDAFRAAKIAIDGLNLRQQVSGQNIANVDTPGYKAQTVNFEDALKQAMSSQSTVHMDITNAAHMAAPEDQSLFLTTMRPGGSARADGNNVDIDVEMTEMNADALRYQALTESISSKLGILKNIAR